MIIIQLKGGLGNQLFQYCFARALAHELGEELFIDISYFGHSCLKHVVYGLHPFNIKGVVGNYPLVNSTRIGLNGNEDKIVFYHQGEPIVTTWGHFSEEKYVSEKNIQIPCYFDGYFQQQMGDDYKLLMTERFFNKYIDLIHEDLEYMLPLSTKSQAIINDMKKYDSVALHIRRGDYKAILDFGLCSDKYYEDAINTMISKLDNPKFFIFCEEMDWVRKNLKIDAPHRFIDFKEEIETVGRGYSELLKVMSSCDHFIIANSTFSWWGSFLGENDEKIIISPKPWYQSRRVLGVDTIDNKKTIEIINDNSELFEKSNNLIYSFNENNFSFKDMNLINEGNSYKITNVSTDGHIILNAHFDKKSQYIIKISLESNCFNVFKIFFKTFDGQNNSMSTYYYEGDNFEHYLLLPENTDINSLMIKPGNLNNEDYLIINSFQIKCVQ